MDWHKPKTTRRYLQPPKAERMFTLWAEGKIIFGEIREGIDWRSYKELDCCGMWFLWGKDARMLDFRKAENGITEDGAPMHSLCFEEDGIRIYLEAFCDTAREATCYIKAVLTNVTDKPADGKLHMLVRSGKEKQLVFASPDEYASYAPDVVVWKQSFASWTRRGNTLRELDSFITFETALAAEWDEDSGMLSLPFTLDPNESTEAVFSFGRGTPADFSYDDEKDKASFFWKNELSRLTNVPERLAKDKDSMRMIRHLTAQLLQCFCYPVGKDTLLARQGGLQRLIWPWESISVLEALGRLGSFSDYIEPVLSLYFDSLQAEDGEIRPMGEGWACITAAAIGSFGRYCLDAAPAFYAKYRDKAMRAFEWIRTKRMSSCDIEGCFGGIFPPMRGCDWGQEFQGWANTDAFNLISLKEFVLAAEAFGDPRAAEVRAEYEDYLARMRELFRAVSEKEKGGSLRLPLCPDGNDRKLIEEFYPCLQDGVFTYTGVPDDRDIMRMRSYLIENGVYSHGLYGHMPYRDGNMHIWYTTYSDYYWFRTFMRMGMRELAFEALEAQMRYSMTDEYTMVERYSDNDPYYVPWSPNASANGRLLLMLIRYYEEPV